MASPTRPKYQRVAQQLRDLIADGTYPTSSCLPTEKELAKSLRVGRQTILAALGALVREGLIVRQRGSGSYVADRTKPLLIPGRNLKIGVLWDRSIDPEAMLVGFKGAITRGILANFGLKDLQPQWPRGDDDRATIATWSARHQGLTVVALGEARLSHVQHPPLEDVREHKFDGLIAVSIIEEHWLARLVKLGIPTVLADHLSERFSLSADQIYADPQDGFRRAVQQLHAEGHHRIHFVMGYTSIAAPSSEMSREQVKEFRSNRMRVDPDSYLRLSAYRQAMDELRLPVKASFIHFAEPLLVPDALLAQQMLALPEDERPTAVVCHSAVAADHLIQEFAKKGARLRGAGASANDYGGPSIEIVANGEELGATAAELLLSRLHRPNRLALRVGVPMTCVTAPAPIEVGGQRDQKA